MRCVLEWRPGRKGARGRGLARRKKHHWQERRIFRGFRRSTGTEINAVVDMRPGRTRRALVTPLTLRWANTQAGGWCGEGAHELQITPRYPPVLINATQ